MQLFYMKELKGPDISFLLDGGNGFDLLNKNKWVVVRNMNNTEIK